MKLFKYVASVFILSAMVSALSAQQPVRESLGQDGKLVTQKKPSITEKIFKGQALGNAEFALNFYKNLAVSHKENVLCSPYSISSCAAMLYYGARGDTAKQMEKAFGFELKETFSHIEYYSELSKAFAKMSRKGITLETANSLWFAVDEMPHYQYLNPLCQDSVLKVSPLDFKKDSAGARLKINKWVEEKTKNKIKDLVPEGVLDSSTKLVLVNAVYFYGSWLKPFDEKRTADAPFFVTVKDSVKIPMMNQTMNCMYGEDGDVQLLSIPYKNPDVSMIIILPKKVSSVEQIEQMLSVGKIAEWIDSMGMDEIIVSLPKFKFSQKTDLKDYLKKMGMVNAFTPSADLSGINGKRDLYVSAAIHEAVVDVNERGTEAAAATMMGIAKMAMMQTKYFRADHPFVFMIFDRANGTILFIGRYAKP